MIRARPERPLAELFRATEGADRADPPERKQRVLSPILIGPVAVAIVFVGAVAFTALGLSVWQLTSGVPRTNLETVQPVDAPAPIPEVATATAAEQTIEPAPPVAEKPKAKPAKLLLTSARGDCWLEVRAGSATGKVLFVGTLERGQSLRFSKRRLWLAFGAGGNLDVTVNGRHLETFPIGTANVIVTAQGVRSSRSA